VDIVDLQPNGSLVANTIIGRKEEVIAKLPKFMSFLMHMPNKTYFSLFIPELSEDLPKGYEYYVISFHEPINPFWLAKQSTTLEGKIICLYNGTCYDNVFGDNVFFYQFIDWHLQCDKILQLHGKKDHTKKPKYKIGAINNRITYSKLIAFTAIAEYLGEDSCLLKLGNFLEQKNVNYKQKLGIELLDQLQDCFYEKYYGREITEYEPDYLREYSNIEHNSYPYSVYHKDVALHICLETYSYSYMSDELCKNYIRPGPELTEKTFKCLVGGTPFITIGQAYTHKTLAQLGFSFDYGPLDMSFDTLEGNFDRLIATVNLIKSLDKLSISQIVDFTKQSANHNQQHIVSGDFAKKCNEVNQNTITNIINNI